MLVPVARTSGSRNDLAVEFDAAVYWNRKYYVEFLDERLKEARDNILQENNFIVLTSVEIISLCCLFAIFHFTVCIPMMFLARNTNHVGAVGYNWLPRSMGKALDAFHDAMVGIEQDGDTFLNEDFMSAIFNGI